MSPFFEKNGIKCVKLLRFFLFGMKKHPNFAKEIYGKVVVPPKD